ncbi:MAG: penicillin-binding protein 2 [Bdellovibrionaceae bacterium]|nr:penicillin-binding protein 2 [Pseudobdellovibrionaceae bacterium]
MSDYVSNPEETKELLPRYRLFYAMLIFTVLLFSGRLWYLQIVNGTELREFSEKNRIKESKTMAPRGKMLDREGRILVENNLGFEAVLTPQYIDNLEEVAKKIAPILGLETEKIVQKVQRNRRQNGPFAPVKVKENLSRDEVFRLKRVRLDTPGLEIREAVVRYYPLKENGAQILGFVSEISKRQLPDYNKRFPNQKFEQGDIIGKSGLEEVLEANIRGVDGRAFLQVDALGREALTQNSEIYGQEIKDVDPLPGSNVVLTVDKDIQEAAYKAMTDLGRIGGLIAMKSNGEILAWVSLPSFDPNNFSHGISSATWNKLINDPFKPMRNKVIQDFFAPGSTFKPFVALAALEEKVITPQSIIYCPGSLRFGRRDYHDHLKGGHGNINVYDALERSSNVFFYKMGISLGIDRMHKYIQPLGVGVKSGIEIPREAQGRMPNSQWKVQAMREEWQPGENLSNAIGQGFVEMTPIQLAVAYNTLAREGKVVKPFIVQKVLDNDGNILKQNQPEIVRDLLEPTEGLPTYHQANFKVVKEGMRRVVMGDRGTARSVRIPGVEIAGKTGTAQVMNFSAAEIYQKCDNRPVHQRHHGWFAGWAPADNPEIVVVALAEHSCSGSKGAGPLVKDVLSAYFNKYHPEMIAEGLKNDKTAKRTAAPAVEAPTNPAAVEE